MDIARFKIGILGGGQLGKMLNYTANQWDLPLAFLDQSTSFPAALNAHTFHEGDFKNYEDVMEFGKDLEVLGIEIEHVNLRALYDLEAAGVKVHPSPAMLEIIKDKYLQNQFYKKNELPTISFEKYDSKEALIAAVREGTLSLPFVQKSRSEGYDGRGIFMVLNREDLDRVMDVPSIAEKQADIDKELAVIVARNEKGEIRTYDPVEMVFNDQNMLDFLYAPADIPDKVRAETERIARKTMEAFKISGLLAIEFFHTKTGEILINEVAPRPHNSGHHTIENAVTSQFEQHLRGLLNLPLGDTELIQPAAMVNILGEPGYSGPPFYEGLEKVMAMDNVHLHFYGKPETRPYRKMGHATICGSNRAEIMEKTKIVKSTLKVISL